ncbi:MAG TPA: ankyrin repeat domain-containing protein [Anaerolineales bacterium]|nr:ankyrin repeat domain-containing protein [Anaerolineales bacterium]
MEYKQEFFAALKAGDRARVEGLLAQNPGLANSKADDGLSAVLVAVYYGKPEMADRLIERGASLDVFEAAATGRLQRLAKLVENDPSLMDAYAQDGFQPLGLAAFFGHLEVVEYLLVKGAEVNSASRNQMQVMPLHAAVARESVEIAKALLEQGAQVNARQQDDFTPLHAAAQNGQVEMAQLLLDFGAEVNARMSNSKTPLALAEEFNHAEVASLLTRRGGTT